MVPRARLILSSVGVSVNLCLRYRVSGHGHKFSGVEKPPGLA